MRLQDKVAIVTGGGQGIGRAYALRFRARGRARRGGRRERGQRRGGGGGGRAARPRVHGDEGRRERRGELQRRWREAVHERFGRIDVLVNNAAIFHGLDRQDQSLAYFNRILSVNLTGVWLMTRAVERFMKRQRARQDHQPVVDGGVHEQRRLRRHQRSRPPLAAVPLQRRQARRQRADQVLRRRARAVGHQRQRHLSRRHHDRGDQVGRARPRSSNRSSARAR